MNMARGVVVCRYVRCNGLVVVMMGYEAGVMVRSPISICVLNETVR